MNIEASSGAERPFWTRLLGIVGIAFGVMTLREGGSVLFIDGAARQAAGSYVPFVVWFNFLAGFAYVVSGVGLWLFRAWAVWLALAVAGATLIVFGAFGMHALRGGDYETRTIIAMSARICVWLFIGGVSYLQLIHGRRGPLQ